MSIKIVSLILLFSFPGGIILVGLGQAVSSILRRLNIKEAVAAIKALCSLVFAEEFSLDGINVDDRAEVAYTFNA